MPISTAQREGRSEDGASGSGDALDLLGLSPAAAKILRYFLVRPEGRPHARELQRVLQLGGASIQRELERLVSLGALRREPDGRLIRYTPDHGSSLWKAFRIIAAASPDPTVLVQSALCDVPGLKAALVFGSVARGTQRADSDIDLFIVEDEEVDWKKLLRQLHEVEMLLGREVDSIRYTAQKLAERLGSERHPGSRFVREVLQGPKRWIAGSPDAVRPLATAAGLTLDDGQESGA